MPLDPPADRAGAQAAVEAARQAHDDAVAAYDRAQHKAEQLADLAPRFTARLEDLRPLAARAAEARRLADLAAGLGANTLRMTLSSFVLAARLEEVAAAASERLLKMTSGRYSLVHTDARRGAGRSGLGLLACDGWTGVDRDTSTLSGGETFLASLALALGLADVVTAEAGGARIEALFVDEGFGSLDEDTLEEVMTVLDGLREGGRMVGIVSHVAELRQRIPAQVRVHKGQSGSHRPSAPIPVTDEIPNGPGACAWSAGPPPRGWNAVQGLARHEEVRPAPVAVLVLLKSAPIICVTFSRVPAREPSRP